MLFAVPLPLMTFTDANVYVSAAQEYLFRPVMGRTAGYPLVLRVFHGIWASPTLPVIAQHLAVVLASVAIYAIARNAHVSRTLAALAAGVWLISIDWVWLEHQLLTETVGAVLLVGSLAIFALAPTRRFGIWRVSIAAGLCGAVLGLGAGLVRPALLAGLPGIVLAALLLLRAPMRVRAASAAVLAVTCGVLFYGYLKVQDDHTHFGMRLVGSELDLGLYPQVAPVAKCSKFTPPPGTRPLCERTPPSQRPTSDWYYWQPNSPGRKLLAKRPGLKGAIKLWASRADKAQAGDERRQKLAAFQRLFGLGSGNTHRLGDQGTELFSLRGADTGAAPVVVQAIQAYYGKGDAPNRPARFPYVVLEDLQGATRPSGPLLLIALAVALAGAVLGRGRAQRLAIVAGAAGWLPALSATWSAGQFNWRYVLATIPLISLAAFGAVSALVARKRAVRDDSPAMRGNVAVGAGAQPLIDAPRGTHTTGTREGSRIG